MSLNIIIANETDSPHPISLKIGTDPIANHTAITRARFLSSKGVNLCDSDDYPDAWDFSEVDKITMVLGKAGLPAGKSFSAKLITHTDEYPDGFLWDDEINLMVLK